MRWPYKKLYRKGKRRISQDQSHRANLSRVFRDLDDPPTRHDLRRRWTTEELAHEPYRDAL